MMAIKAECNLVGVVTFTFSFDSAGDDNYFAKFYHCKKINAGFQFEAPLLPGNSKKTCSLAIFLFRLTTTPDVKRKCNIGHVQQICVNPIKEGFERDVRATLALHCCYLFTKSGNLNLELVSHHLRKH